MQQILDDMYLKRRSGVAFSGLKPEQLLAFAFPRSKPPKGIPVVTITIKTDNAAFEASPGTEVARILRQLADRLMRGAVGDCPLMDSNGNKVGEMKST